MKQFKKKCADCPDRNECKQELEQTSKDRNWKCLKDISKDKKKCSINRDL